MKTSYFNLVVFCVSFFFSPKSGLVIKWKEKEKNQFTLYYFSYWCNNMPSKSDLKEKWFILIFMMRRQCGLALVRETVLSVPMQSKTISLWCAKFQLHSRPPTLSESPNSPVSHQTALLMPPFCPMCCPLTTDVDKVHERNSGTAWIQPRLGNPSHRQVSPCLSNSASLMFSGHRQNIVLAVSECNIVSSLIPESPHSPV